MSLGSMMATHPPLEDRIRRIDPQWDGVLPDLQAINAKKQKKQQKQEKRASNQAAQKERAKDTLAIIAATTAATAGASSSTKTSADNQAPGNASIPSAMESIGVLSEAHVEVAQQTLAQIPDDVKEAAHEPFSARALVYCLLLDQDAKVRQIQLKKLQAKAHPASFKVVKQFEASLQTLPRPFYLPLLDLCLPALKQQSPQQYQIFKRNMIILIRADQQVDVFEWALYRIVSHGLEPHPDSLSRYKLKQTEHACQLLLSIMARTGHDNEGEALQAYSAAAKLVDIPTVGLLSSGQINLQLLDKALEQLNKLKPLDKPRLLKAMAASINHDGIVTPSEAELFRAIADSLDCPVPPLLQGQQLV